MSQNALGCQDVTVSQFSEPGNSHEHLGGVTGIDRPLIRATGNCQSTLFLLQDTVRRGRWIAPDKLGQLLRWARDGVGCFDGECGDRERRVVGRAESVERQVPWVPCGHEVLPQAGFRHPIGELPIAGDRAGTYVL